MTKILGIGNAIVDILCKTDDSVIEKHGMVKGTMSLIYDEQAEQLSEISAEKITSGGSAGNTIAALAQLGCNTSFIGKVGHDHFGKKFIEEIEKTGTKFLNKNLHSKPSARSFVLVSNDGQRTMATYLGCASEITEEDIREEYFKDVSILYLEGYLWDAPATISALKKAISLAKKHGAKIAFSLSDRFCILRHKQDFIDLVHNDVDILFANQDEAVELTTMPAINWSQLSQELTSFFYNNTNLISVITKSEEGCAIFYKGKVIGLPTVPVDPVDSTGAGDAFAAGFLYGILQDLPLEKCGKLANQLGKVIIQKFGARFEEKEIKAIKLGDFS